ncbi:MAG: UDP-N-acetylmuramate--L-alanine ligase [Actinomycetota bacterium]
MSDRASSHPEGWRRAHLVGIGGAGMSGIARLLLARGIEVTGSDLKETRALDDLRHAGAEVFVGHERDQVGRPDVVVASSAIPESNVELEEARESGVAVLSRAEVLASLMRGKRSVAVAGTHGKTTTTSMISVMLSRLGLDPTFVIGGDVNEIGSGAGHGSGEIFVAEADESDGSFLLYEPEIAVITNVEEDHLDYYSGREDVEAAFAQFAARSGSVVACWDDPGVRRALAEFPRTLLRYGVSDEADVVVRDEELLPDRALASLDAGEWGVRLAIPLPGRHNLLNAAAAIGVARLLGLPVDQAAEGLGTFGGVRRRFEHRGEAVGATFVDDYAHHPSEIRATLEAASLDAHRRIIAVFQPHRYTRTRAMWRALGESLKAADLVVLMDVYGAGEVPIPGVTGKLLVDALTEAAGGKRVVYLPRRSDVVPFLASEVRKGDLVMTLGAGDITMVSDATLDLLGEAEVSRG